MRRSRREFIELAVLGLLVPILERLGLGPKAVNEEGDYFSSEFYATWAWMKDRHHGKSIGGYLVPPEFVPVLQDFVASNEAYVGKEIVIEGHFVPWIHTPAGPAQLDEEQTEKEYET